MTSRASSFAAATALAVALGACSRQPEPVATKETSRIEEARAVSVAVVELKTLAATLTASGLLLPREEAAVTSELQGYRIATVLVEEGDTVKAGQPLAQLDDTLLRAKILQGEASVAQAKAQAAQAQAQASRVAGLDGQGILSDEEIQQRRTQATNMEAGLDVAKAQLAGLQTERARLTIRSPVAGVILERNARPGDVAGPSGTVMFRLARDGLIELAADIPEDQLGAFTKGEQATVTLSSGTTLPATLRLVAPRVDPKTKLALVRFSLPKNAELRPGGFARVSVMRAPKPVPAVPEKAVQFEAGGAFVAVIDADDRAHRVPITPGTRAGGWVELVDGPPPGTRVALGGGAFILDGDKVRPVPAADTMSPADSQVATPASKAKP
jgi:HlyD family secretion protein